MFTNYRIKVGSLMVISAFVFLISCIALTAITIEKQNHGHLSRRKKKRYMVGIVALAFLSLLCWIAAYVNADYNRMFGTIVALLQGSPL